MGNYFQWLWPVVLVYLYGLKLHTVEAQNMCESGTKMVDAGESYRITTDEGSTPGDYRWSFSINSTSSVYLDLKMTFLTKEKQKNDNNSCSPFLILEGSSQGSHKYACPKAEQEMEHQLWESLQQNDYITMGLSNPGQQKLKVKIRLEVSEGSLEVNCKKEEVIAKSSTCPCGGNMAAPGGLPYAEDVSVKQRLTVALVCTFVFLLAFGIVLAIYYIWRKRRQQPSKETVESPKDLTGSENKAFQTSKGNLASSKEDGQTDLGNSKKKIPMSHDPDLNLNMQKTPGSSVNDSSTEYPYLRGSTDSGLYSMPGEKNSGRYNGSTPYATSSSLDDLSRSQPDIAGHPDIFGTGQGGPPQAFRPSPAELEAMYAQPNKVRQQPQGGAQVRQPPRASSRDNLNMGHNRSYNEMYASDDSHNTSQTVETDV